jgi:hypothetical protein
VLFHCFDRYSSFQSFVSHAFWTTNAKGVRQIHEQRETREKLLRIFVLLGFELVLIETNDIISVFPYFNNIFSLAIVSEAEGGAD